MKEYIVLNGSDATYTNNRLSWNLAPNTYFTHMPQDGNVDIYMRLKGIRFTIATVDDDAVDGTCLIDTNLGIPNLHSTDNVSKIAIVETFLKSANGGTQYVSPAQIQSDISLKVSKFNTIALGVYYEEAYLNLSVNKENFNAIFEISYVDNLSKELM